MVKGTLSAAAAVGCFIAMMQLLGRGEVLWSLAVGWIALCFVAVSAKATLQEPEESQT